jgi:hypothetical protein
MNFGLPCTIVLDQDSKFLSNFLEIIVEDAWFLVIVFYRFHPHINGHIKKVNKTLIHFFCIYPQKKKQQDKDLHIIQHTSNRTTHASIRHSPFKIFYGAQPLIPCEIPTASTCTCYYFYSKGARQSSTIYPESLLEK